MNGVAPESLVDKLLDKSVEAFILAIEIYNKPTIKYRVEGFSFFICNAWELMLKAKLIKDGVSIYYTDDSNRTLGLSDVIKKVYTDKRQPLRINLEKILDLRNTSTHFVTNDYESVYAPFFQANILNFVQQTQRFHSKDVTKLISQNFLTLSVNQNDLSNEEILGKYTPEMAQKLIEKKEALYDLRTAHSSNDLFISIKHNFLITRDKSSADFTVAIEKDADRKVQIIKELINPNDRYTLTFSNVIKAVNKHLQTKKVPFNYIDNKGVNQFNSHTLSLLISFYGLKNAEKYSYEFADQHRYSQQMVEFIINEIRNDADIIINIKKAMADELKRR